MLKAKAIFRFKGTAITPQGPASHQVGYKNIWQFSVSLLPCMKQEVSRHWLEDFLTCSLLKFDGMWLIVDGQGLLMNEELD